jgi:predicted ATPase/class 3 adenylate cyclase
VARVRPERTCDADDFARPVTAIMMVTVGRADWFTSRDKLGRGAGMAELPTGTVTFFFTDLEVSTRLWDQEPDAMRAALARHDAILRDAVAVHGGQVVKGRGDGVHAVFATADDAIGAAVDAQVAMSAESWDVSEPLRVRIGIHSGAAELRGGDYFGSVVNRAARLEAVAHGGQIVCSQATADLVRDSLPASVELVDLGDHTLRDLARRERVFQVAHPDLAREFAPLASLDAFGGNLPVHVTSFVGREEDVARIVAMLDEVSLVTLIGTGGVGKTRLAVQVAAEVMPRFADGAWFCELAAADDGDAMAQVIAANLGCRQRQGLSLADSIVQFVKVRELLLVLDNCEHLLDDAGALADAVLRVCPRVRVLATSREALDVAGERVVRVWSLEAPPAAASGEELVQSAAVELFADRCADVGVELTWDAPQWAAVGEICRRVDGIPLAIELAAARTPSMSPVDIAAHLDERFRLLTGKRRGRVERHQTLRATVEWSYQLLDSDGRVVFDRLGVFAGSFDGPAATAVACGDDLDAWEVTEALSSLIAKSMLSAETGPDGTSRYAMNETLRQFARERLEETGDADRWRRRHAEHYAAFAVTAGRGVKSPDEILWIARVHAELDELRAAVGWALDREDPADRELAVRIVAALAWHGQFDHTTGLDALAAQAATTAEECHPELRSPALALASYYEFNQGRPERARALADDARRDGVIALSSEPFMAHQVTGYVEILTGHPQRALEVMNEARDMLDTVNDPFAAAQFLISASTYESLAGEVEVARADAEQAIELARRLNNPRLRREGQHALAWALQRDEPDAALRALEPILDPLHHRALVASSSLALAGGLRARLGDPEGAIPLLRDAVIMSRDHGARPSLAAALDWSLSPLVKLGRPEPAATLVGALTGGPLAEVSAVPLGHGARVRTLERIRTALGDETTDTLVADGAAMTYDELVQYAIRHLDRPDTNRD